jgi:glycosyltransferase involved in cell wall biosynthesis
MRIVLCSTTYSRLIYSSEHWLARGLLDLGHDVTILATDLKMSRAASWGDEPASKDGTPVEYVRGWRLDREPLLAMGIDRAIRDGGYQYGIVTEDWRPTSFLFAAALKRHGIPYTVDSERYSYGMGPVRTLLQQFQDRTVAKKMLGGSKMLTCHSTACRDFHVGIGVPPERVSYLPAGTDTRLFTPGPPRDPKKKVRILSCGRLEHQKGFGTLVTSMARVENAHLTIKGRGPLSDNLWATAIKAGVADRVSIVELTVPKEQMPDWYRAADIYVQPSLDEPFGHSVIEAMSCGVPIVASSTGGLRDSVEDYGNGYSVPPGDTLALADAINRLVWNESMRREFGYRSREIAEEKFDCRKVAQQHVDILRRPEPEPITGKWPEQFS